jgi:hypothetical protein
MLVSGIFKHKYFYIPFFLVSVLVFFVWIMGQGMVYPADELEYGVTFSHKHAQDLGLDWQQAYLAVLDELGVRKMRLSAYWDETEEAPGIYRYEDLDWQLKEAQERGLEIILAVGGRLPRWPECHFPAWAENMDSEERQKRMLQYIRNTIERYQDQECIVAWQVENEPFLNHFGDCPNLDKDFLDQEISLVRELDDRPVVVTDSGELSVWIPAARRADIFGTTMYRDTYSQVLDRYVHYPIGPGFFHFKRNVADWFAEPDKWIVIELQAEPWGPRPYQELSREERNRTMNLVKFREILEFSRLAGFREFYLWGVEWWYWEKEANGQDALWEEAKQLF